MSNSRMDDNEDQEVALFHPYPCAYYVESPSTNVSHADSPSRSGNFVNNHNNSSTNQEVSRYTTLSRYSSSRGSSHSFLHEHKKIVMPYNENANQVNGNELKTLKTVLDHDEEDDEWEGEFDDGHEGWWWRYCSFRRSSSCGWISLQISWRLMVSFLAAVLVFYIATKPSPPKVSLKIAGIRQFELGEGVDLHGVGTKILSSNFTMNLVIDNKSKIFGLHIHQPILEMSFGRLPIAISHGPKLFSPSNRLKVFKLYVGTKNKPLYGAGRNMQDLLNSRKGLPLIIRVSLSSNYRVVWNLVKPKYQHQAECILVLDKAYDKKHRTQKYRGSCRITS